MVTFRNASLSYKILQRRVENIAAHLIQKLKQILRFCFYFLAMNKNTDYVFFFFFFFFFHYYYHYYWMRWPKF